MERVMMGKVFISYASEDSKFVDELVNKLQLRSVDVWYAKHEIKIGDSIVQKINEGINNSDWLLLVLSKASVKSRWVTQELNSAVALTVKKGAFILPVLIDSVEIPVILIDRKYADFVRDPKQAFRDILSVVAPGSTYFDDEDSQIAWGILSKMFTGMIQVDEGGPVSHDKVIEIRKAFSGFKSKWDMTDAVYNVYIDCCLDAGRLLNQVEFIEKTPEISKKASKVVGDEIVKFLLKKLDLGK
jgi:hypothetical protein